VKSKRQRLSYTPRSQVRSALRRLWLRSRERRACLKRDHYTCVDCNRKQTKAKGKEFIVEVDHLDGIDWEQMIDRMYDRLLVQPQYLETVCHECHDKRTAFRKQIGT
jgi:5-methylcytosine-specific restriction endonuclease McrA